MDDEMQTSICPAASCCVQLGRYAVDNTKQSRLGQLCFNLQQQRTAVGIVDPTDL
jgi:hypothetical protein